MTFESLGSWPGVLTTLLSGTSLTADQAEVVLDQVWAGDATPAQVAGLLVALRA